jgi:hypothetical protein
MKHLLSYSFLLLVVVGCERPFWMHEEVHCHAAKVLRVRNERTHGLTCIYRRPKRMLYGDSVYWADTTQVVVSQDTLTIGAGGILTDTINYFWTGADYCQCSLFDTIYYSLYLDVYTNDSIVETVKVLPWDDYSGSFEPDDIWYWRDTLILTAQVNQ